MCPDRHDDACQGDCESDVKTHLCHSTIDFGRKIQEWSSHFRSPPDRPHSHAHARRGQFENCRSSDAVRLRPGLRRRAAADAFAATVRSPAAPPSLAIAALCVRAARAHSGSSRAWRPGKRQAGIHGDFGDPAVRQFNRCPLARSSELASGRGFAVRPLLRGFSTADAWSELFFANACSSLSAFCLLTSFSTARTQVLDDGRDFVPVNSSRRSISLQAEHENVWCSNPGSVASAGTAPIKAISALHCKHRIAHYSFAIRNTARDDQARPTIVQQGQAVQKVGFRPRNHCCVTDLPQIPFSAKLNLSLTDVSGNIPVGNPLGSQPCWKRRPPTMPRYPEDVLVDTRGYIYVTDKQWGLWILRYTGPDQPTPTDK